MTFLRLTKKFAQSIDDDVLSLFKMGIKDSSDDSEDFSISKGSEIEISPISDPHTLLTPYT
jgi:hypothetical protein